MILSILLIVLGLALLVGGAQIMIRGATALATALGVSPVVIGLTVVAFGTSAPELVVNSTAALNGQPELAFGNIVGSSTINLGWVLAMGALVRPIAVEKSIISRELPMMLLATASFAVLVSDSLFDGASHDEISRGNGVMLLLPFGVFLYYTVAGVLNLPKPSAKVPADPFLVEMQENLERQRPQPTHISILMTVGGLIGLVAGGRLTVSAAVNIANVLGVPEFLIGLTIVSFGTTLPELVTCVLAGRRGNGDLALGNVVGSNIFNLLCIGGIVSIIAPIPEPAGGGWDLLLLMALSALVLPMAIRGPRTITRAEGAALLVIYFTYLAWRVATTT